MASDSISSSTPIVSHSRVGDEGSVPRHIAIIMDGNGRWAKSRGLPRTAGHKEGVEALRRTVDACKASGVQHLSVFSFSTENWRRPKAEVNALFGLLRLYVERDLVRLHSEGVRIRVFGSREGLGKDIVSLLDRSEELTKDNNVFHINIAFNYGGRSELVEAARSLANDASKGLILPSDIDEDSLASRLWSAGVPDVDLLIRTSGEERISNFMLWSIAYAELLFVDVLWPDFSAEHLQSAINEFKKRNRRYGGVAEPDVLFGK